MKITGFEIDHFGLWSGLAIPKLKGGLNVFYGGNEAGKSTVMEFIRAQLYGFGEERRRYARRPSEYLGDWTGDVDPEGRPLLLVSGGLLEMDCPSGKYRMRRTFVPDKTGGEERVDLRTLDGSKQGSQLLRVLLSGVDETTFNNVFAIGLDELQRLSSLNDTEAAEMLFRLSVGLERISIVEAIKDLTARRNRILDAAEQENKPSRLTRLLRQRAALAEKLGNAKLQVREYVRLQSEQRGVDRTIAHLEEDVAKLQREKRIFEIARQVDPTWLRRDKLRREIDGMGNVVVVTEEIVTRLDSIGEQIAERRDAFEKLKAEYLRTRQAVKTQPVNETLWKLAPRIEVLLEEEKRIVEIDGQITKLENEIAGLEARVVDEETLLKQGRRSLPITLPGQSSEAIQSREKASDDGQNPSEHASFSAGGAVISAPSTSASATISAKGYRHHVGASDLLDAETLEDYRIPARAVAKSRQRLQRAREQHKELLARSRELNDKIQAELQRRGADDLAQAVQQAGETVGQLRRRQAIGQRLGEMTQRHKELHRVNVALLQNQSLSPLALAGLVSLGILGAIPIGLEIFKSFGQVTYDLPPILSILGVFFIAIAVAAKVIVEKNSAKKLQENQRQLAGLLAQIERAKQDAAAVDSRLSGTQPVAGSFETRLRDAQQELALLEKLVPVDAHRRETNLQLKTVESRVERSKQEHAEAARRWSDWLRVAGLPNDWTPSQIRDLMEHYDVVGDLKKELDYRYEMMNQRIRDMRNITDRIDRMIVESGLSFEDGMSYVDILNEIRRKLAENDEAIKKRDKLKDGLKQFVKMRRKALGDLSKAKRAENDLLRQFGVKKPDELRELHRRHLKHRRLLQQEQGLQREIDAAIGDFCEEDLIASLLDPRLVQRYAQQQAEAELERLEASELAERINEGEDAEYFDEALEASSEIEELPTLDELIKAVQKRIETTSNKLHAELEQRGLLLEQLKELAEDQTAIRTRRELAILDEKIEKAKTDWRTYGVCGRMLDVIRATYERERQPRTLAEASELLRKLTDGKYHRIWTPLGEETLLVDDGNGNTFDVTWLSRGTRELLFIALRLSLASAFAQHGSVLPIILDDVLVNFDSKRSMAAARVFLELAQSGRQIFLFTCHEHVCRMFQRLDVPVRILPPVDDPGRPGRVLLPLSVLRRRRRAKEREAKRLQAEQERLRIEREIDRREQAIRLDALRKAEVQRLILQMQQQATAEKAIEADREALNSLAASTAHPQASATPLPEDAEEPPADEEEWWEDEEDVEDA